MKLRVVQDSGCRIRVIKKLVYTIDMISHGRRGSRVIWKFNVITISAAARGDVVLVFWIRRSYIRVYLSWKVMDGKEVWKGNQRKGKTRLNYQPRKQKKTIQTPNEARLEPPTSRLSSEVSAKKVQKVRTLWAAVPILRKGRRDNHLTVLT